MTCIVLFSISDAGCGPILTKRDTTHTLQPPRDTAPRYHIIRGFSFLPLILHSPWMPLWRRYVTPVMFSRYGWTLCHIGRNRSLFFDFGTQRTIFGTIRTVCYENKVELYFGY